MALLTLSDLNMVITFFALSRLGYSVLMLSPHLPADACAALLQDTACHLVLYGQTPAIHMTVQRVESPSVHCFPISEVPLMGPWGPGPAARDRPPLPTMRATDPAVILHSSGSTGRPKPVTITHGVLVSQLRQSRGLSAFNTLPWYHGYGLVTALQAMWARKTAFMWDASQPITAGSLVRALQAAAPESVHCVPAVLQLVASRPDGIDALRECQLVAYCGAACPDDLGDYLVAQGVRFGGVFGSYVPRFPSRRSRND